MARRAAFRLRLSDTLDRATALALFPVLYAVLGLTLVKVLRGSPGLGRYLAYGAAVPVAVFVAGVLRAVLKSEPSWRGALALDRERELHDRVTNALSFSKLREGARTPMM